MIYLKLKRKPRSVKELIVKLYSLGGMCSVPTYRDKECTMLQCGAYCNRSFDDIYEIVQTYFPGTKKRHIVKTLLNIRLKSSYGTIGYPYLYNCGGVKRPCISFYSVQGQVYHPECDDKMICSQYKWSELLALVGRTYSNFAEGVK